MIFTTLLIAAAHLEIAEEEKKLSAEVEARHLETTRRVRAYEQQRDEINAIANAKIGTPEFRRLMMQLNERGGL